MNQARPHRDKSFEKLSQVSHHDVLGHAIYQTIVSARFVDPT